MTTTTTINHQSLREALPDLILMVSHGGKVTVCRENGQWVLTEHNSQ